MLYLCKCVDTNTEFLAYSKNFHLYKDEQNMNIELLVDEKQYGAGENIEINGRIYSKVGGKINPTRIYLRGKDV